MAEYRNFEREAVVAFASVACCVMLALGMTGREVTRRAMDGTAALLHPLEKPAMYAIDRLNTVSRWLADRRALLLELAQLREENRQLRLSIGAQKAAESEKLLRSDGRCPIVFRDPAAWWDEIRVDSGGADIAAGSAALDGAYLAGVVRSTAFNGAWIQLLSNSTLYIPVVVETTREVAVITGDNEGGVWLHYLPEQSSYPAGTQISTVLGGQLPAGIPVGVITGERRVIAPGMVVYRVKPGSDLFRLQAVHIMRGKKR